jgi:multisubunit Na+/H+ antiporter MnhC subunit
LKLLFAIWSVLLVLGTAYAIVSNDAVSLLIGLGLSVTSILGLVTTARKIKASNSTIARRKAAPESQDKFL